MQVFASKTIVATWIISFNPSKKSRNISFKYLFNAGTCKNEL